MVAPAARKLAVEEELAADVADAAAVAFVYRKATAVAEDVELAEAETSCGRIATTVAEEVALAAAVINRTRVATAVAEDVADADADAVIGTTPANAANALVANA